MSETLSKIFPFFDYLYIYQNFEYKSGNFLYWFFKNPFKRNLQKKHQLVWTFKAKILASVSLLLICLVSWYLLDNFWLVLMGTFLLTNISPIFLVLGQLIIYSLEYYQKQQILNQAKEKLSQAKDLKVVAITGSFGKTSTKDILYTLLWKKYYVVKTPKSFNTPLSIANTILDLVKDNTNIFICEIGAYKKGEIKNIANLIKPEIGVITAVAAQHLESFGSLENIASAKFELPQSLVKEGTAVLNGNFDLIKNLAPTVKAKVMFYGNKDNPFYVSDIKTEINGTSFIMHTPKGSTQISIPLIGEHHAQNFLAASVIALNLGLTLRDIKYRAKLLLPTPHRMEIMNMGSFTLIDNSYNTNPTSAKSSLALLKNFKDYKKIIITPGFVELGEIAPKENQDFGENIACIADIVIIVGEHAKKDLLQGIKRVWKDPEQSTYFVNSTQEALNLVKKLAADFIQKNPKNEQIIALLENDLPDQYY